jgi:uncharacterized protein YdeI (YjbR/CyaY-like superfamily)
MKNNQSRRKPKSIRDANSTRTATLKTFTAESAEQWRKWLVLHHDCESEVWLVFYKRHTGRKSVAYNDAVDEALCFGWIDSLIKRLDDNRYARKFTRRKPDSKWSTINRKRYAALQKSGRLMPAGIARPPTDRSGDAPPLPPSGVPGYIARALKKHPAAWSFFDGLAPSHKRNYVAWIDSAKRQETRLRRLDEAVRMLGAHQKPGLK